VLVYRRHVVRALTHQSHFKCNSFFMLCIVMILRAWRVCCRGGKSPLSGCRQPRPAQVASPAKRVRIEGAPMLSTLSGPGRTRRNPVCYARRQVSSFACRQFNYPSRDDWCVYVCVCVWPSLLLTPAESSPNRSKALRGKALKASIHRSTALSYG